MTKMRLIDANELIGEIRGAGVFDVEQVVEIIDNQPTVYFMPFQAAHGKGAKKRGEQGNAKGNHAPADEQE